MSRHIWLTDTASHQSVKLLHLLVIIQVHKLNTYKYYKASIKILEVISHIDHSVVRTVEYGQIYQDDANTGS